MEHYNSKEQIFRTKKVFISTKIKKSKVWNNEEDEILMKKSEQYGHRNWKKIAAFLENRSSIQCSARYKRILTGLTKGNWIKKEDDLVIDLVTKYGKNWSVISKFIPSRTGKQIRDRYLNTLDININRDKFSNEEDEKLLQLYLQYGTKWSSMAKLFEKRTGDMIKNRFYSTLRKRVHGLVRFKKIANRKVKRIRNIRNHTKILYHNNYLNDLNFIYNLEGKSEFQVKNNPNYYTKQDDNQPIYKKQYLEESISRLHELNSKQTEASILNIEQLSNLQSSSLRTINPEEMRTKNSLNEQSASNAYLNYYYILLKMKILENYLKQSLINYDNISNQCQNIHFLLNHCVHNIFKTYV